MSRCSTIKILLLASLLLLPLTARGQSFSDDFNRADQTGLGASYTTMNTLTSIDIASNTASKPGAGGPVFGNYYSAITWPNDQYMQATVNVVTDRIQAVILRSQPAANTYYACGADFTDFDLNQRIWKVVAGTPTSIATNAVALANSDIVFCSCVGTTLTMYINGVQVATGTDSAIASGNGGLLLRGNAVTPRWDNATGGAVGGHSMMLLGVGQ